ncbi:hypothetical protein JRG19_02575 [Pseudoclavibacter alba]|uniref:hypothetical protein n=1 Tax=Pseudoclavibacter albus TaxID=272241 RepID=UPI0019D0855C|nr:hypothetical protein [Pseudoclavibacter alba]MBN6777435.1 hypothetical protein [Pseudoclavibacter alba]
MMLAYIERLLVEPWSEFRAAYLGDPAFLSWTPEVDALVSIFDAVRADTHATVRVGGGKMPRPKQLPRPRRDRVTRVERIADFPIHRMVGG